MRGRLCFTINCAATIILTCAVASVYLKWHFIGKHSSFGPDYPSSGGQISAPGRTNSSEGPETNWLANNLDLNLVDSLQESESAQVDVPATKDITNPRLLRLSGATVIHHEEWNGADTETLEDNTPEMVLDAANSHSHLPQVAAGTPVAVINCVNWHFEIVLGFAQVLHLMRLNTTVYMVKRSPRAETAMQLLKEMDPGITIRECREYKPKQVEKAHLAILVSAQEEIYIRTAALFALRAVKPKVALAIHHNTASYRRGLMVHVSSWHPRMYMMALAPNPLEIMKDVINERYRSKPGLYNWILPVYEFHPEDPCSSKTDSCLYHFTVQGRLEPSRRNYTRLFEGLEQAKNHPDLHVKLVGNFVPEHPLKVPEQLEEMVSVHPNLPFKEYYEVIHQSVALLPLFSTDNYITGSKISSSVITALICDVPLVATSAVLEAYPFLTQKSTYLHDENESEVEVMNRIASWSAKRHAKKRRALKGVRAAVLRRTVRVLTDVLQGQVFV